MRRSDTWHPHLPSSLLSSVGFESTVSRLGEQRKNACMVVVVPVVEALSVLKSVQTVLFRTFVMFVIVDALNVLARMLRR
jgi:hypothetical protein